jgi:hypothetical protein
MPFTVPESLLGLLRARREEHRLKRCAQLPPEPVAAQDERNFIARTSSALAGASRAAAREAAQGYVNAMNRWQDEIEEAHDAFLLYPGMGPMLYLTADGRVLEDGRGWDGDDIVELDGDRADVAIAVGAKTTGINELLELLPPQPPDATTCAQCSGTRWSQLHPGVPHEFPCTACSARGWSKPA